MEKDVDKRDRNPKEDGERHQEDRSNKKNKPVLVETTSSLKLSGSPRIMYLHQPFTFFPTVENDNGSGISFSATNLPPGAVLDPTNGGLKGISKKSGTFVTEYTAKQSGQTATAQYTFQIFDVLSISGTPHAGYVGKPYQFIPNISYTGNRANLSWSASNLPPGLSINASTGEVTGEPLGEAIGTSFITCTDNNTTQILEVNFPVVLPLSIYGTPTPGFVNTYYQYVPLFNNLPNGNVKIVTSIVTGTLPDGLILNENGSVTGIPTTVCSNQVTFMYDIGYTQTTKTFTFAISAPLKISSYLNVGYAFLPYSSQIILTNEDSSSSYTYQIVTGSLPEGISLNTTTGVISGTAIDSGIYDFVVEVSDGTKVLPQKFTLTINSPTQEDFLKSSAYTGSNTLDEVVLSVLANQYFIGNLSGPSNDDTTLQKFGNILVEIFNQLKTRFTQSSFENAILSLPNTSNSWVPYAPSTINANLNQSSEPEFLVERARVFYVNLYNAFNAPSISVNKSALMRAGVRAPLAMYLYWVQNQSQSQALTNSQPTKTVPESTQTNS